MKFLIRNLVLVSAFAFGFVLPCLAQEIEIGQVVILQEMKPVGVPLHQHPPPKFWKHVATGTQATIENIGGEGRWIAVRLASGETAWVNLKYILLPPQSPSSLTTNSSDISAESSGSATSQEAKVWATREQCEQILENGGQMASLTPLTLRLGTWNLRWFPDGKPDTTSDDFGGRTDLEWLACTIIWMQVDILAVQESLATPEAQKAWGIVIRLLQEKSGAPWRWTPQVCGKPDDQHIGYLWNTDRVTLSLVNSLWEFNVKAKSSENPCKGGLRPGHYAWVESREEEGVDFHLIALHLKSGPTVFSVEDRHGALNRIDQASTPLLDKDADVVILGDFNTMGAGDRHSQRYELKSVRRQVAREKPGFQDLPPSPQCTHYFRGRGSWLDHIVVAKDMQEVTELSAKVTGYCAVAGCKHIKGDYPLAYHRLSDHCPVIIEIKNRDED